MINKIDRIQLTARIQIDNGTKINNPIKSNNSDFNAISY